MPPRKRNANNNSIRGALLVKMFEQVIETHSELGTKMDKVCRSLEKNTDESTKLLKALSGVPEMLSKIRMTLGWIKYGLLPVIATLTGLIIFFATRR